MHFEKTIELDPDYAMPYVNLASSIKLRATYAGQDKAEVFVQVQNLLDKALSLDPLSGEAWAALGMLREAEHDFEEAEKYYLKAIELSPNYATAYHWYSNLLNRDESRQELALQYIRKSIELDPLADIQRFNLATKLRLLGRTDEMYGVLKQGHARNPDFVLYYNAITEKLKNDGQLAEALRWSLEGRRRNPHGPFSRTTCLLFLNLAADQLAEQCILKLMEDFPGEGSYWMSELYLLRAEFDKALAVTLEHYPAEPEKWNKEMLAWMYLQAGNVDQAMEIANNVSPQYFGNEPVSVSPEDIANALLAVFLLQAVDQNDRAKELGRAALETMKTMDRKSGYHFWNVVALASIRDRPGALTAFREAIDSGLRLEWWRTRSPLVDNMREEPEWNAMIEELDTDISRQRQWFFEHRDDPLR